MNWTTQHLHIKRKHSHTLYIYFINVLAASLIIVGCDNSNKSTPRDKTSSEVQSIDDGDDVTTNPNSGDGTADNNKPPAPNNAIVVIDDNTPPPRSQGSSPCLEGRKVNRLDAGGHDSWINYKTRGKRVNSDYFRVKFSNLPNIYNENRSGWTFSYLDAAKGKTDEDSDGKILYDKRPRIIKEIFIAESFSCHKNATAEMKKRSTPCHIYSPPLPTIKYDDTNGYWTQSNGFNRNMSLHSYHFRKGGSLDQFLSDYLYTKRNLNLNLNRCGLSDIIESNICSIRNNLPGVFIKIWQYGWNKQTKCAFPEKKRWLQLPVDGVIALAELGGYGITNAFPWKSRLGYESGKTLLRKWPIVGTSYTAWKLRNWLKTQTDQDKERMLSQLKVLENFAIEAYNYSEFEPPGF